MIYYVVLVYHSEVDNSTFVERYPPLSKKKVQGKFVSKESRIKAYAELIHNEIEEWTGVKINLINRAENEEADALARLGVTPCPKEGRWVQIETIVDPSIEEPSVNLISKEDDWRKL